MVATILIIEDDDASRELLMYLLEAAGYATLTAADGGAGLRVALESRPDLVLCDLQMPVLNGFEVIRQLHADPQWRRIPMIAVTAFSMPGDREAVLAAGFDAYMSKPVTPETFVRQVEAYLPPESRAPRSSPP